MPHKLPSVAQYIEMARRYPRYWQIPAAAVFLFAVLYAFVGPRPWEATQILLVRNEAAGGIEGPGKFRVANEMKAAQEMIIEIARTPSVLHDTLVAVGPPKDAQKTDNWPTRRDVEDFGGQIKISPPKGTEFGATEVVYVKIKDDDRERAIRLTDEFCKLLSARLQEIRDQRAESVIKELTNTVAIARQELADATAKVHKLESEVGSDLAELRMLYQPGSESDLRRRALEIENELRDAMVHLRTNEELLRLLESSRADHGQLLATPNRLLESQPALRRLKDGLVDAQLRTAQLRGVVSEIHPRAIAARDAEEEVARHLNQELETAVRGVKVDLKLASDRVSILKEQLASAKTRMERLAGVRAEYANLLAAVQHRTQLLEGAERKLSEAQANQIGAQSASLINRVDAPDTGPSPAAPSRALILAAGLFGGLLTGAGALLLLAPMPSEVAAAPPATKRPLHPATTPLNGAITLKQALSQSRRSF